MDEGERQLLESLAVERRLLALGVIVEGAPYVGQVPFALTPGGDLLIHVSKLDSSRSGGDARRCGTRASGCGPAIPDNCRH